MIRRFPSIINILSFSSSSKNEELLSIITSPACCYRFNNNNNNNKKKKSKLLEAVQDYESVVGDLLTTTDEEQSYSSKSSGSSNSSRDDEKTNSMKLNQNQEEIRSQLVQKVKQQMISKVRQDNENEKKALIEKQQEAERKREVFERLKRRRKFQATVVEGQRDYNESNDDQIEEEATAKQLISQGPIIEKKQRLMEKTLSNVAMNQNAFVFRAQGPPLLRSQQASNENNKNNNDDENENNNNDHDGDDESSITATSKPRQFSSFELESIAWDASATVDDYRNLVRSLIGLSNEEVWQTVFDHLAKESRRIDRQTQELQSLLNEYHDVRGELKTLLSDWKTLMKNGGDRRSNYSDRDCSDSAVADPNRHLPDFKVSSFSSAKDLPYLRGSSSDESSSNNDD